MIFSLFNLLVRFNKYIVTINLKIKDIDFTRQTITTSAFHSKTAVRITKKMMGVFYEHVKSLKLEGLNPEYYVFSQTQKPGSKKCYDDYFSNRFYKVKQKFNLSRLHTLYGFRHTFVSELLDNGADWHEIMKYTGHTNMEAFQKYARSIMNKPAKDLSSFITIKF